MARQQLLLDELAKDFKIDVFTPKDRGEGKPIDSIITSVQFHNYLIKEKPDAVLARGDRYEMLPIVYVARYQGIPVIHLEGGDVSGVIDNEVRHAITALSQYHFATNDEAHARLVQMGAPVNRVWNYGSLDVEFAKQVKDTEMFSERKWPFILASYHPIPGEDSEEVEKALKECGIKYLKMKSNKDYGQEYGEEVYSPKGYVVALDGASVLVGNSSSFLKEASILGTPVVLVGNRQHKRLLPHNVLQVPCEADTIKYAIEFQMKREFEPDYIYYKEDTSKNIAKKIKEIL